MITTTPKKPVMPRFNRADKWRRYERNNPGATADQIEAFCQRVAREEGV